MNLTGSSIPTAHDFAYQTEILQKVSKTFALTIPQLPVALRCVIENAYLLCRMADTIEDEPNLDIAEKKQMLERFVAVVAGQEDTELFSHDLGAVLTRATSQHERALVANADRIFRITGSFNATQRAAIERCLDIMAVGMVEFQERKRPDGLDNIAQLDRYCYYVAGVVAEMLAELFCDYSEAIHVMHDQLLAGSVSYGQGLQMTNILKDIWDDKRHGICWLPRDLFLARGVDIGSLSPGLVEPGFVDGLSELVAITRRHLADGLQFILTIPSHETGIRRHLLWTLGLSVLALRRIYSAPSFKIGEEINVSRGSVRAAILATNSLVRSNPALKLLFNAATCHLPRQAT